MNADIEMLNGYEIHPCADQNGDETGDFAVVKNGKILAQYQNRRDARDYCRAAESANGVDEDGDCLECGHPANGSSGSGHCDAACHTA